MAKYQPGDRVRVRLDLKSGQEYCMDNRVIRNYAIAGMVRLAGQIVTIQAYKDSQYRVLEDVTECYWTDEMFEDEEIREKITQESNDFEPSDMSIESLFG